MISEPHANLLSLRAVRTGNTGRSLFFCSRTTVVDLQFKTKPYDHQLEEFKLSRRMQSRCLFWEMGTGKTKPVIDQAADLFLAGEIDAALVIAPNGVHQNWILDELPAHMPEGIEAPTFIWESKRRKTKLFQAEYAAFISSPGLKWLAITYDAIMTDDGAKAVRKYLDSSRVFYVADETTFIKTPGAKRTKRVIASGRHAAFTRVLNGTPVSDSPFHAYSQVRFSDPNFWKRKFNLNSFTEFKTYFGIWEQRRISKDRTFPQLIRYRNLKQLNEALDEVGSRLLKEDVLDLPPKIFNKIYYKLSPAQQKLYDELKRDFITWFGDGSSVTAELAIVRMTRMQQICSGYLPADDEKDLRPIGEDMPRLKLLMETLETVPRQAIIWAKYNIDIDSIAQELKRAKISFVTYDGRTSSEARQRAKEDFKAGKAKVFLGKPSAAGRGLTLTAADTVIFYDNTFVLDDRLQAEDRAHRLTQTRTVNYIDIVAAGTVDEHILKILREKRNISACCMGDELPPWI